MPSAPLSPRIVVDGFKGHHGRLCQNIFHFFLPFSACSWFSKWEYNQTWKKIGLYFLTYKKQCEAWHSSYSPSVHGDKWWKEVKIIWKGHFSDCTMQVFNYKPYPQKITNLVRLWYDSAPPTEWSDERQNLWWSVHVVRPGIWLSILFKWELLRKEVYES